MRDKKMKSDLSVKGYPSLEKINLEQIQSLNIELYRYYLEVINEFAIGLLDKQSVEEIVWFIAKNAMGQLGFEDCVVYLLDEKGENLIQRAAHGIKSPNYDRIVEPISIPLGEGIVGSVAKTGELELINDVSKDDRYIVDIVENGSELAVPIRIGDKILGVIDSEHAEKDFFSLEQVKIMRTIASMTAIKISQARALEKIENHQLELEQTIEARTKDLKKSLERLEKSNKAFQDFSYIISHDLREPLRTIASYLQLFAMTCTKELSAESKDFLNRAVDGAVRMDNLILGVLEYSKLDKSQDEFQEVSIQKILSLIGKSLGLKIEETKAVIEYKELPTIKGIEAHLIILFQNLIDNALKFRSDERIPLIQIFANEEEAFWEFRVQDNGIGMKNNERSKNYIFNIFHRLNTENKTYKGTGLGLALCKNIVERHGGEIRVESKENVGSCFIFTIKKY